MPSGANWLEAIMVGIVWFAGMSAWLNVETEIARASGRRDAPLWGRWQPVWTLLCAAIFVIANAFGRRSWQQFCAILALFAAIAGIATYFRRRYVRRIRQASTT